MDNTEAEQQEQQTQAVTRTIRKAERKTRKESSIDLTEAIAELANGALGKCLVKIVEAIIRDILENGHLPSAKFVMDLAAYWDAMEARKHDEEEDDDDAMDGIIQSFAEFLWNQP